MFCWGGIILFITAKAEAETEAELEVELNVEIVAEFWDINCCVCDEGLDGIGSKGCELVMEDEDGELIDGMDDLGRLNVVATAINDDADDVDDDDDAEKDDVLSLFLLLQLLPLPSLSLLSLLLFEVVAVVEDVILFVCFCILNLYIFYFVCCFFFLGFCSQVSAVFINDSC